MGKWKLITGYPGLFDGWESKDGVGLTHIVDLLPGAKKKSTNKKSSIDKKGNYAFDFGAIMNYISNHVHDVQLYNLKGEW